MGLGKKFAIIILLKDTSYPPLVPSVELVRGATLNPANKNQLKSINDFLILLAFETPKKEKFKNAKTISRSV